MSQLFGILYKSRHFFLFLALQILCFYLMSKNNVYWDVSFFNTTNTVVAKSLEVSQKGTEFINLGKVNDQLSAENVALRKQLTDMQEQKSPIPGYTQDSTKAFRFDYTVAKVVGSTHNLTDNFITIDKGTEDGVKAGMGVISPNGVVGQVAYANKHYSRVYSVLHSKQMVSAEVLSKKLRESSTIALGIAKWGGTNARYIQLNTVDRFKPVAKGDSVVTSLQNPIFPPHIMIGKISDISNSTAEAFHTISVRLSTDFSGLVYVYVVKNKLIESQKEAENNSGIK
jgi:rod shape-determining protein MreC